MQTTPSNLPPTSGNASASELARQWRPGRLAIAIVVMIGVIVGAWYLTM